MRLLLITGLPGSGKTTLAQLLAQRYRVLLLSKDGIKEPLLATLGAGDAAHSRRLSDASFAVLFAVARAALAARLDVILEGNFRPGIHEAMLAGTATLSIVQVLCRIDEAARRARLAQRQLDAARAVGHGDADPQVQAQLSGDAFLALSGQRVVLDTRAAISAYRLADIDRLWRSIA